MPKSISAELINQLNSEQVRLALLFQIVDANGPGVDLLLCSWSSDLTFFKDIEDSPGYVEATYQRIPPVDMEDMEQQIEGESDTITIRMGNADNDYTIQSLLTAHDALRGKKVVTRLVSVDHLANPESCIKDTFWVDSAETTPETIQLQLAGKISVENMSFPGRRYTKYHCQHEYKGLGCWLDDGSGNPTQPPGFVLGSPDSCTRSLESCKDHGNTRMFGGCPGIPEVAFWSV